MTDRAHRIYCPEPLGPDERITLAGDRHHYLSRVLRLKTGANVIVFDGTGGEYPAVIEDVKRAASTLWTGELREVDNESPLPIRLAQGIGRGERTDFAIQKAVELGVTSIVPLLTRRGVVRLTGDRARRRIAHWEGIIVHACQQCGRNRLPELHPVIALDEWLRNYRGGGTDLVLDPDARHGIEALEHGGGVVSLLVGPEGGLDPTERAAAAAAGFHAIRLGPRILRTETAAVAALTAVQSRWGDL